ncbi:DUF2179 domain-containing protein [Enterococcus hirae]|jgi:uncharacterized protein YebE (UPF0316 family)|nr:DUF2179 domain-containing protein [Enterococcaceae bacterium]MCI1919601.1 DUF2179 domain-containing protein [Enterococcaceae bacterium]MDM8213472.1 DUF2179 domain-containing protein [Enterococcus hirae]
MDVKILLMTFFINFAYVAINTIRLMLTMKGYRFLAPLLSMVEITIYVLGLSLVLNRLDQPLNLFVYALGYAVGVSAGIMIEDKLALGYVLVTVILPSFTDKEESLPEFFRKKGYGVTETFGMGRTGERLILQILSPRKNEIELYRLIKEAEEHAFVITYEPKYISGGFWTKRVNRWQKRIDQ